MGNLNAEQIIKALECCVNVDCTSIAVCPRRESCKNCYECVANLKKDALALIEELTEENERLRGENAKFEAENHAEFNKWLKLEEATKRHHSELFEEAKVAVKEETVRKMQNDLYVEFSYLARCQEDDEPNMKSQEVFGALDRVTKKHLDVSGNDNLCVSCGKIIPEGRQVCPLCECKRSDEGR